MRHLRKTPQANQRSVIWVWIEDFQGSQQRVPGIFNCVDPNRSVIAQGIWCSRNRFCDLQLYPLLGSKSLDVQAVGELHSVIGFRQFIVAWIEAARLPIAGNIDVRKFREEEVNFRRKPGSIASRVLPVVTRVVGSS